MAVLTFAQDFSSLVELDSSLIGEPSSGLFYNRGVHPLVTIDNLLNHLPVKSFTLVAYSNLVSYSKFETSRSKSDVVTYDGKTWESLADSNLDHTPSTGVFWRETNIQSLRLRAFVWGVEDNMRSELHLSKSLIESQYVYNVGKTKRLNGGDYVGWAFEPKNSDFVKLTINEICLQATTTADVNLYVINQGRLIETLVLHPNYGVLEFETLNYSFSGKGVFYFVFENIEVLSEAAFIDALKFDSFVCYPVSGVGSIPEEIDYSENNWSNGLSFNISVSLDSDKFILNNENALAKFKQCQFEIDAIQLFLNNPNGNINGSERNILDRANLLATEKLDTQMNTVAKKYQIEKKKALSAISKTFDKFLQPRKTLEITMDV